MYICVHVCIYKEDAREQEQERDWESKRKRGGRGANLETSREKDEK